MNSKIHFEIMNDINLIGARKGDIVTLKEVIDDNHVLCTDKDNRDVLLKLERLHAVWCCKHCHYTYDDRGNCKCLR